MTEARDRHGKEMLYPDFIGIGAQKSGTTWLHRNLQLHPQIWIPTRKEIHYFDEKINDPPNFLSRMLRKVFGGRVVDHRWRRQLRSRIKRYLNGTSKEGLLWDLRYYFGKPGDGWYASLFEPGRGSVVGEITPEYSILDRSAIAHVRELMPEAKIIFMMRNPIERAWSQAVMSFDRKTNDIASVEDARLYRSFDREGSQSRTDYLRTLEIWGSFYPPERIFIGFLEDVHFFPDLLLRRLYNFLEVEESAGYRVKKRKVHSRAVERMPTRFAAYLARSYHEQISELDERFGGYASFWLYCADRLVDDSPGEGLIPYPLWESAMWTDWIDSKQPRFQSGPLSSVQITS
jgi:hypothetical protein